MADWQAIHPTEEIIPTSPYHFILRHSACDFLSTDSSYIATMDTEFEQLADQAGNSIRPAAKDEREQGGLMYVAVAPAGFPSPAHEYLENRLDLNQHLIKHPAATFFVRVSGDSMIGAGIFPGDMLIVDRSLEATDKKVVIAVLDGELTVKRLRRSASEVWLTPENSAYKPIRVNDKEQFEIWGVVTNVIHAL